MHSSCLSSACISVRIRSRCCPRRLVRGAKRRGPPYYLLRLDLEHRRPGRVRRCCLPLEDRGLSLDTSGPWPLRSVPPPISRPGLLGAEPQTADSYPRWGDGATASGAHDPTYRHGDGSSGPWQKGQNLCACSACMYTAALAWRLSGVHPGSLCANRGRVSVCAFGGRASFWGRFAHMLVTLSLLV